jgi:hypothetical protein
VAAAPPAESAPSVCQSAGPAVAAVVLLLPPPSSNGELRQRQDVAPPTNDLNESRLGRVKRELQHSPNESDRKEEGNLVAGSLAVLDQVNRS